MTNTNKANGTRAAVNLRATTAVYFIGGMMPESASPAQQLQTIIEIRPYRGGWQCYEGPGVGPHWIGHTAKEDAISYATARAKFGRGEIRVLNSDGSIERTIPLDRTKAAL